MRVVNRGCCSRSCFVRIAVAGACALSSCAIASAAPPGRGQPVITPLVMQGDVIPGLGTVASIENIAVNNHGDWVALVRTTAASNNGVLVRNGNVVLRETSGVAPEPATIASFDSLNLADSGEAGCNFALAGTGGSSNNSGVYLAPGGRSFTPALTIQEGAIAPQFSPATPFIAFFKADVNDNRQMLVVCSVDDPNLSSSNDRAIYRMQLNAAGAVIGATLLAAESSVLPGQASGVADFGTGAQNSAMNDLGDVMFVADLGGPTAVDGVVYLNNTLIAQEGSPSPIADRNWGILSTSVRMDVNNAPGGGGFVHTGALAGDAGSDQVIVSSAGKVIQEGDTLPDAIGQGFQFTAFGSGPVEIDDSGNVLWFGDWNDVTAHDTGLFINHDLIIQEGVTVIEGQTVGSIANTADGYHMSDNGSHIIAELTLFDGTAGAFMITFPETCTPDVNHSGAVDVDDLIAVILSWGCTGTCAADINHSGNVDVDDLIAVILGWGACP